MLQPKRTKFRKMQKGRVRGLAQRGSTIAYGSFAIKTMEVGFITSRQIEAARIAINRYMKREGKVWIRIFPDKPITSKPAEVRMGRRSIQCQRPGHRNSILADSHQTGLRFHQHP